MQTQMCVVVLVDTCSLSLLHDHSMAIHSRFLTAIELFQHNNKYAEHKIFCDAFERGVSKLQFCIFSFNFKYGFEW